MEMMTQLANPEWGATFRLLGVAGFFAYLGSFAALQFNLLDGNSTIYSVMNVIAASLVLVSLFDQFNLASALIQSSWILIGLSGLALRLWRRDKRQCDSVGGENGPYEQPKRPVI